MVGSDGGGESSWGKEDSGVKKMKSLRIDAAMFRKREICSFQRKKKKKKLNSWLSSIFTLYSVFYFILFSIKLPCLILGNRNNKSFISIGFF